MITSIAKSNYGISQPSTNGTSFVDEYNSQIRSICIITGNPSFKSANKEQHLCNNSTASTNRKLINSESDPSGNLSSFRAQHIYDVNHQDLNISQQTLNSNSNANHSVNTIDTLDIEDLRDLNNENNLNSSVNKPAFVMQKNLESQQNSCISTSVNSLNSLVPTNLAATTISISGSIGDDASATSEVMTDMLIKL